MSVDILKTVPFDRWQQKENISDDALRAAIDEMRQGLIDADLGGGVVKKRLARAGGGKSAGYRTLLATNKNEKWLFIYGFAKNERDNIAINELRALKLFAKKSLALTAEQIRMAIVAGELKEIIYGEIADTQRDS
jgi:hypothetical protein